MDITDGHYGAVYEYGGTLRNGREAEYRAALSVRRMWVEKFRMEGKGNCASFRAGLRVPVSHADNVSLSGDYLLTSVRHIGGWQGGAYTYRNEFTGVRADKGIYAPPLRTPVPRIDGVTTATVGATGDAMPTLDVLGRYNVNMPFVLKKNKNGKGQSGAGDYGDSKAIRVAQPSGGMSGGKPYGMHFPSKRGAEMVLAFVDGNPNRPIGLGFVPNAASPSVAASANNVENVIRSWGGSELVMTDTAGDKKVKLSTPEERYLELYDGKRLVRVKSEHCEMLFNDGEQYAEIDAGGHRIHINNKKDEGRITVATLKGNVIRMDDPEDIIAIQNAGEDGGNKANRLVLDGKEPSITIDSNGSAMTLNGKDNLITMESEGSKIAVDGQNNKISLESNDSKITDDGGGNGITLDSEAITISAKCDISLKAGGKIIFDAKGGILNKSRTIDLDQGDSKNSDGTDNKTSTGRMKKRPQSEIADTDAGEIGQIDTIGEKSMGSIGSTRLAPINADRVRESMRVPASEQVFVRQVRGSKKEALSEEEVEYAVVRYSIDNVAKTHRNNVKWVVKVDGKYEKQKDVMGEKITLKMKPEWADKDILVMAYLDSPREDVGEKTKVTGRILYTGTKKWGTLQRDLSGNEFSASGHNYTLEQICALMYNGKLRLGSRGTLNVAKLNNLSEKKVKSIYENMVHIVLSDDDDVQNKVIDNFYTFKYGEKLSFNENSKLSTKLQGYEPFEKYYKGYLKVLKKMLEENTLKTIDGIGIIRYFEKLNVPDRPDFSHLLDIYKYDYYGLMGNTQTIKVDLDVRQTDIKSYSVRTIMYIGDWYGADFDDINGGVENWKGSVQALNAFFWLQHHYNCHPFETEIIVKREDTINLCED